MKEAPQRLEELEKRIRVLEDIEAIKRLMARYARTADDNYNPEEMAKLFTEDGVWDGGEVWGIKRGRKEIKEFLSQISKDITFAVHYITTPDVTVEGDRAHGRWYELVAGTYLGRAFWLSDFYRNEFARVDGEWLLTLVKCPVSFMTPYEEGWAKTRYMDS